MLALRRKRDFRRLFAQGRRVHGPWAVLHARLRPPEEAAPQRPRLAVSTAGRFPNAVSRNRARRLVRETCRPLLRELKEPWDLLIVARPPILATTFPERQAELAALLRRAGVPVSWEAPLGASAESPGEARP